MTEQIFEVQLVNIYFKKKLIQTLTWEEKEMCMCSLIFTLHHFFSSLIP